MTNRPGLSATGAADFSLVHGGPQYQLWRRLHLSELEPPTLLRRLAVLVAVVWVPLVIATAAAGHAMGTSVPLSFFGDFEMQARLLVALPLMIVAERAVYRRLRSIVQQFLERDLIPESGMPAFDAALTSATRLRNSVWMEVLIVAFVYVVGVGLIWRVQIALNLSTWYGGPVNGVWRPTAAGWWLMLVSLPVVQVILVRWYYRLFIWARFLWSVSRIPLQLQASHPDRCGGLGFLSGVSHAFAPLLLAQGTLLAGMMANRIFYTGARLTDFQVELAGLVVVLVSAILGPLLVFSPQLEAAKSTGTRAHGRLAQRYVRDYDRKWLRGQSEDALLGSADIQSLADLTNSFEVVRSMRLTAFTLRTALELAVTTLAPVLPLLLTMMPMEDLVRRLLTVIF